MTAAMLRRPHPGASALAMQCPHGFSIHAAIECVVYATVKQETCRLDLVMLSVFKATAWHGLILTSKSS